MASDKSSTRPAASLASPASTSPPLVLSVLSYNRVLVGAALMLAPNFLGTLCAVPISPYTSTFLRLIGLRDAVLGEHLWFSFRSGLPSPTPLATTTTTTATTATTTGAVGSVEEAKRAEVRRTLLAHMAIDGIETVLLAALYAKGGLIGGRFALVGGVGSAAFAGLGAIAYRSI